RRERAGMLQELELEGEAIGCEAEIGGIDVGDRCSPDIGPDELLGCCDALAADLAAGLTAHWLVLSRCPPARRHDHGGQQLGKRQISDMSMVLAIRALANERRLLILERRKDLTAHFP